MMEQKEWKILCIGNSFSQDILRNLAQITRAVGMEQVKLVNLFYSACSIRQHYYHAVNDLPAYRYDLHTGPDWPKEPGAKIGETVASDDWDWICV